MFVGASFPWAGTVDSSTTIMQHLRNGAACKASRCRFRLCTSSFSQRFVSVFSRFRTENNDTTKSRLAIVDVNVKEWHSPSFMSDSNLTEKEAWLEKLLTTTTNAIDTTSIAESTASFDGLIIMHVLEHVRDDRAALRELHRRHLVRVTFVRLRGCWARWWQARSQIGRAHV